VSWSPDCSGPLVREVVFVRTGYPQRGGGVDVVATPRDTAGAPRDTAGAPHECIAPLTPGGTVKEECPSPAKIAWVRPEW